MGQKFADFLSLFIVGILSLGLLAYVGYGEARRNYPPIEIDKVAAQARPIQFALEKYLNAGLPLRQFVGFEGLAAPVVNVDDAIDALTVTNRTGEVTFQVISRGVKFDEPISHDPSISTVQHRVSGAYTEVILPLRSRFGFGGQIILHVPNRYIQTKIDAAAAHLPWIVLIVSAGLGLVGAGIGGMAQKARAIWDKIAFVVAFLLVTMAVVFGLLTLYSGGVQSRAANLGGALAERLRVIYDLDLALEDIEGVDQTLGSYRSINPDIGTLAMIVNGRVLFHTDAGAIGKPLVRDREVFDSLAPIKQGPGLDAAVYASIPYSVLLATLAGSAKTFAVLLVASAFVAGVFFQLGGALRRLRRSRSVHEADGQSAIEAIKPVLFMGFFVENLAVSFLPQWMQASVVAADLPASLTAAMFMAYFVAFAAVLAPAGNYAGRRGPKPLILGGAVLVALAAATIALSDHYLVILLSRIIAGVGQGALFIGGQSYILAYSALDKRTQGAGIIVYSFNGGMLSGMAIGGLLVGYLAPVGVFWLGAGIIGFVALYTWAFVAPPPVTNPSDEEGVLESRGAGLGVFRERGFLWATLLVGIPTKMILTGVIIFAMPLILSSLELERENISQIIMFYAVGVLTASHFISRYADRFGRLREILFFGLCLTGLGLTVIGAVGLPRFMDLHFGALGLTITLLVGVLVVGLGHGFVNAPIITYVGATRAARDFGHAPVTAFYRLIERIGHIGGPLIVGQAYFLFDRSPVVIAALGVVMLAFAGFFLIAPSVEKTD